MSKIYKCTICKKKKQVSEFYLRTSGTVGEYKCKPCIKDKRSLKYIDDYENVRSCNRKAVSEWQKRNLEVGCAKTQAYQARKSQALPPWLTQEDLSKMKSVYKMCRSVGKKTGTKHQVDHIVPLNGETVCGLHVPWNLQILSAYENRTKSNKLEDIVYSCEKS